MPFCGVERDRFPSNGGKDLSILRKVGIAVRMVRILHLMACKFPSVPSQIEIARIYISSPKCCVTKQPERIPVVGKRHEKASVSFLESNLKHLAVMRRSRNGNSDQFRAKGYEFVCLHRPLIRQKPSTEIRNSGALDIVAVGLNVAFRFADPLTSKQSRSRGATWSVQTGTAPGTVSQKRLEPRRKSCEKNLMKSMVGVTGFEPATPTSRTLGIGWAAGL